jgi:hypothetical protein
MPDDTADCLDPAYPWILVFAHPGHELRAYHFMERVRPGVAVLTDGSGSANAPRLEESRTVLARTGARPAATFGPLTDREAYAALMAGDARPFLLRRDALVDELLTDGVRAVVVDAAEGYNPVHDVCHWIGRSAVTRAQQFGVETAIFEVDLLSHPDAAGEGLRLVLDDQAFARKLEAISGYVALKAEVEAAFERHGQDAFRVEFLRRVHDTPPPPASFVPDYEQVGEARVRAGLYASALRYGSHVRPIIQSLLESVQPRDHATDFRTLHE